MSTEPDIDRANALLRRVFGTDAVSVTESILNKLISAPSDAVYEVDELSDGDVEVWLSASGITGEEKDDIEVLYEIKEISVYGDPNMAGAVGGDEYDGKLYLRLDPRE